MVPTALVLKDAHRDSARHTHEQIPDPDSAQGLSQCALNIFVRRNEIVHQLTRGDTNEPARCAPERIKSAWKLLEERS